MEDFSEALLSRTLIMKTVDFRSVIFSNLGPALVLIVAYSHHRFHDFGGRALVTRMSFSPSSLSMLCNVQSVAWLCKPGS